MKLLRGPLAVLRRKSKLTSAQAAEALGISRTWLGRIERGESNPSFALAEKMGLLFNISPEEILRLAKSTQARLLKQLLEVEK